MTFPIRWMRFAGVALLSLLLNAYGYGRQGGRESQAVIPVADTSVTHRIVARVGPINITAGEFLLAYDFGPAFVKREKDSKRKFLGYMIDEKLLALDAAERGERTNPSVVRSVNEIVHDLATEELYRDDVLSKVHLSEDELQDGVAAQRVHYALQWIYSPTREGIEQYRRALDTLVPFDTLFRASLGDSVTPDLRSWETTRFKVRTTRPEIAAVADTLKVGKFSAPVEGPDGWYLLYLKNMAFDAVTTTSEAEQQLHDAREVLTQQKADSLSDLYVDRLMRSHAPVIQRETLDLLSCILAQTWLPGNLRSSLLSTLSVDHEIALAAASDPGRFGNKPLVKMNDRVVAMKRFLEWYDARSTILRLRATSVHAFQLSLEQLVWRMVRDGLLVDRAFQRKLQNRESVRTQRAWWEDKVLFAMEKRKFESSIPMSDAALKAYYSAHRRRYTGEHGDTLAFAAARNDVTRDYVSQEMTKLLFHRLVALRRKYPVRIEEQILASLPVDSENDRRAIDVYVAKKGGTFPHPAFPTIDYDWQTWE
ncbi:MAG: hypothetical protein WB699_14875 [Bacteroidota bacterium]